MAESNYHRTSGANWRKSTNLDGNFVGLEIETHNNSGKDETIDAVDSGPSFEGVRAICETDGSISHTLGTEVIAPPVPLANALRKDGFIAKLVDTLVTAGATVDPERNYGLHINLNTRGWDKATLDLFGIWVMALRPICQSLGKRVGEAGARDGSAYWVPQFPYDAPTKSLERARSKYCPVHVRDGNHVVEIRYPKAVLDFQNIRYNISFLYSVKAFIETKEAQAFGYYIGMLAKKNKWNTETMNQINTAAVEVYGQWLKQQSNFRKLFAGLNLDLTSRDKAYSHAEVLDYADTSFKFAGTAVQGEAVQWSKEVAGTPAKLAPARTGRSATR